MATSLHYYRLYQWGQSEERNLGQDNPGPPGSYRLSRQHRIRSLNLKSCITAPCAKVEIEMPGRASPFRVKRQVISYPWPRAPKAVVLSGLHQVSLLTVGMRVFPYTPWQHQKSLALASSHSSLGLGTSAYFQALITLGKNKAMDQPHHYASLSPLLVQQPEDCLRNKQPPVGQCWTFPASATRNFSQPLVYLLPVSAMNLQPKLSILLHRC